MKTFYLQALTPEKTFFEGEIVRLTVTLSDGGYEVLGGHLPSVCKIVVGKCELTLPDNTRRIFACNDGTLNIARDKVSIFSDLLEWEEDLKKAIKERMELIDKEQQRRKQSDMENKLGLAALQRAFWYLKNDKSL